MIRIKSSERDTASRTMAQVGNDVPGRLPRRSKENKYFSDARRCLGAATGSATLYVRLCFPNNVIITILTIQPGMASCRRPTSPSVCLYSHPPAVP